MTSTTEADVRSFNQKGWHQGQPATASRGNVVTAQIHIKMDSDGSEKDVTDRDFIAFGNYDTKWIDYLAETWTKRLAAGVIA